MSEAAKTTVKEVTLAEAIAARLDQAWTEYIQTTELAETYGAMSVMLAGRIIRLQNQLNDLRVPEPPPPLLLGIEEPEEEAEDEGVPKGTTVQ